MIFSTLLLVYLHESYIYFIGPNVYSKGGGM